MIRLLIVHEVRLMADLTASVLQRESDLKVVTCVYTTDAALTWLRKCRYNVILVSVALPNDGAATLMQAVAKMDSSSKVLITGLMEAKAVILPWLEAGAAGYVHQDESVVELVQKIRSVNHGEFHLSPALAGALMARLSELGQQVASLGGLRMLNPDAMYGKLSERECEVLALIEQGSSNQGVANHLYIEVGTVKHHVHNILDKLGVQNRRQASIIVRQAVAQAENARQN
jgi:two-component system nitrate/nitrite response regulator NarL